MCGRFVQTTDVKDLAKLYQADLLLESFEPGYNIAPTSTVATVRISTKESKRVLGGLIWGLIPSWASDPAIGARMANARAETVAEKPSFRTPFKKQRCLVPVDGFYEWKQEKVKLPFFFTMKDRKPFVLAGLWDRWDSKDKNKAPIYSFTLITTEPNSVLAAVHDRMPVILHEKDFDQWLDPGQQNPEILKKLLSPFPADKMQSTAVSTYVSSTRNQGPRCIEPL
jgi:putative SOS response-associated peptidase YedK